MTRPVDGTNQSLAHLIRILWLGKSISPFRCGKNVSVWFLTRSNSINSIYILGSSWIGRATALSQLNIGVVLLKTEPSSC